MAAKRLLARASVFVIMRNEAGEILLQQRANTGFMDGYYDFAAGGHVDEGESMYHAAVRELKEELGVTADERDLKLVHVHQNYVFELPYINFTFSLSRWQGTPTICEPDKCSDLRYFAPDKLPPKSSLAVRVSERVGFSDEVTYSLISDQAEFLKLVGGTPGAPYKQKTAIVTD